jgi:hypothetical protein
MKSPVGPLNIFYSFYMYGPTGKRFHPQIHILFVLNYNSYTIFFIILLIININCIYEQA